MRDVELVENLQDCLFLDELHELLGLDIITIAESVFIWDLEDVAAGRADGLILAEVVVPAHVAGHALAVSALRDPYRVKLYAAAAEVEIGDDKVVAALANELLSD